MGDSKSPPRGASGEHGRVAQSSSSSKRDGVAPAAPQHQAGGRVMDCGRALSADWQAGGVPGAIRGSAECELEASLGGDGERKCGRRRREGERVDKDERRAGGVGGGGEVRRGESKRW